MSDVMIDEYQCVHCEEYGTRLDHWQGCAKHPANAMIAQLQADRDALIRSFAEWAIEVEERHNADMWADSVRIGELVRAEAARIVANRPEKPSLERWLVALISRAKHDRALAAPPTPTADVKAPSAALRAEYEADVREIREGVREASPESRKRVVGGATPAADTNDD